MRLRKEIRGGSDGFDRILMSASGLGCVKTPLAEALTNRDFGELTVFGHLAVFGGLFCLESS